MKDLTIDSMLTIDATGMPAAPNLRQLLDKDVAILYTRDKSPDKSMYIKEAGLIYYLADPKSPCRQEGLSDKETIERAIENYDLPKNYTPDLVVWNIVKKYSESATGPAMRAVVSIRKAIHNITIASDKINELLNELLSGGIGKDEIPIALSYMDAINNKTKAIPDLLSALRKAESEVIDEQETVNARGGQQVVSSMIEE